MAKLSPPIEVRSHWLVRLVENLRRQADVSQRELSKHAGKSPGWWAQIGGFGRLKALSALEDALQLFGWELVARPMRGDAVNVEMGEVGRDD